MQWKFSCLSIRVFLVTGQFIQASSFHIDWFSPGEIWRQVKFLCLSFMFSVDRCFSCLHPWMWGNSQLSCAWICFFPVSLIFFDREKKKSWPVRSCHSNKFFSECLKTSIAGSNVVHLPHNWDLYLAGMTEHTAEQMPYSISTATQSLNIRTGVKTGNCKT